MTTPRPATAMTTTAYRAMARPCARCGVTYLFRHVCSHPLHAAIDPQCVYTDLEATPPATHLTCDICRPIRSLLPE